MNKPLRRWVWGSNAVLNMRDLGGYVCDGGTTRYGVVLRSDQLNGLDREEMDLLVERGLTDVIDLRSESERTRHPNDFEGHESVKMHTVVLNHNEDEFQFSPFDFSCMGEMYLMMADANASEYARMLRVIADAKGISVVHCMAGKDRTGIVCALLLLLLGVDKRDVVADYQVSMTYLGEHLMGTFATDDVNMPQYMASSEPKNMWMLVDHLETVYGGAEAYLRKHGLRDEDIDKLRQKMIEQ
ncbi:tyrosine-protein phosphatase [Eubacteriales bacterium OttesenSCG-928-N13]|nr:tyrosine-protein phosphatase [Eubacteriales bacterium OttesenSCG-928-N13]